MRARALCRAALCCAACACQQLHARPCVPAGRGLKAVSSSGRACPQGSIQGLATVQAGELRYNLSVQPLVPAMGAAGGGAGGAGFASQVEATVFEGGVVATTPLSPNPTTVSQFSAPSVRQQPSAGMFPAFRSVRSQRRLAPFRRSSSLSHPSVPLRWASLLQVDLAGLSAVSSAQVYARAQGGLARVELRGLNLTFSSTFSISLGGAASLLFFMPSQRDSEAHCFSALIRKRMVQLA